MADNRNPDIAERVLSLYGTPGFETWALIGKALRMPKGSAWCLAHGLMRPTAQTLTWLELAEFRRLLPQAASNLAALVGQGPVVPTIYGRAQARKLKRRR